MMGRAKTVAQCGFLVMIFFVSGMSALRCYSASTIVYNITGHITNMAISDNITTCSKSQNACVEAQVTLRVDQMVLLVTDRRCANKELDGAGSNSSGDPHFTVKSSVRYCFTDLCNQEMSRNVPRTTGESTVPEESNSTQCYTGLMFSPKSSLEKVTCRMNNSQCYHGRSTIQTGRIAMTVLISTCRSSPCVAPMNQSFGPMELRQWGSCCNGSYCNRNKMSVPGNYKGVSFSLISSLSKLVAEHGKERIPPVPGTGADTLGPPFKPIPPKTDSAFDTIVHDDDVKASGWPRYAVAKAVRFQSCPFCPLLIALGIAGFGAWW